MKKFVSLFAAVFAFNLWSAEIEKIDLDDVKSRTIKTLTSAIKPLNEIAEKEASIHDRDLLHYKVSFDSDKQKEWQALRELVDEVNAFQSTEDGEEQATAYLRKKPSFYHIAQAFVSDYYDPDDLSKEFVSSLYKLRNSIRDFIKRNDKIVFYKIFSSNESQGHLGFIVYNRRTDEAVYVSTISDH